MPANIKPLKRSEYSENVELALRKVGKDYCEECGNFLHGSEVSPERLEAWVQGREEIAIWSTCRAKASLTKRIVIFVILLLFTIIGFLLFS